MKKNIQIWAASLILLFLFSACSVIQPRAEYPAVSVSNNVSSAIAPAPAAPMVALDSASVAPGGTEKMAAGIAPDAAITDMVTTNGANNNSQRLIIKNGYLAIQVENLSLTKDKITALVNQNGGYIVQDESSRDSNQNQTVNMVFRVTANNFETTLDSIRKMVVDPQKDILTDRTSGNDVTAEYVDQQSRLHSLEITATQLEEILKEAKRTEDVLAVFNQLQNINQQIEVTKGQIKYLQESSQLSAVNVILSQKPRPKDLQTRWEPALIFSQAGQKLIDTGIWFGTVLIWGLVYVLPLGLILGGLIWLFRRMLTKMNR